ncbi:MAG: MmgE/PrpD family protein, partial [Rhodospirillaceae bacterium]|nr:MmgE/PrpD family protein [Rhodospirillaceae bacterium]
MGALTESLVSFIADADAHTLPDSAEDVVRTGFCDTVGVMIAGLSEPVFSTLSAAVAARGGNPEARVA